MLKLGVFFRLHTAEILVFSKQTQIKTQFDKHTHVTKNMRVMLLLGRETRDNNGKVHTP